MLSMAKAPTQEDGQGADEQRVKEQRFFCRWSKTIKAGMAVNPRHMAFLQ